jgi:hypothetical protein
MGLRPASVNRSGGDERVDGLEDLRLAETLTWHQVSAAYRGAEVIAGFGEEIGQFEVEGVADAGEQLRGSFFLTAFDLGEIPEADPCAAGDITQGTSLTFTMRA